MTHYCYGSGMPGCLYDYGPNFAPRLRDAIEDLVSLFGDSLEPGEEKRMRRNLRVDGGHRFENPVQAGAVYCEVSKERGSCPKDEGHLGRFCTRTVSP